MDMNYTVDTLFRNLSKLVTTPLGLIYLVLLIKEWRFSQKHCRIFLTLYAIIMFPINCFLWVLGNGSSSMEILIMFFNIISGFGVTILLQNYPLPCFLFVFLIALNFLHISETLKVILAALWGIPPTLTSLAVGFVACILLHRYFSKQLYHIMKTLKVSWLRLSVFPILLFLSFLAVGLPTGNLRYNQMMFIPALLLCVMTYSFYLLFYYLFSTTLHQQEEEEIQNILLLQIHSMERQIANFNETNTYLRTLRHDLRHYVATITACVEHNDLNGARTLLSSLNSKLNHILEKTIFHNFTGEPMVDSILSYHLQRAKQSSIRFDIQLLLPQSLHISTVDLTIILSNALENALNACEQMTKDQERFVSISSVVNGNQLFLEITNSYEQTVTFDPRTHLPTNSLQDHGLGSQSIQAIVQANHGICNYITDKNIFRLQILFNLD